MSSTSDQSKGARRTPFAAVVVALLALGLIGQLALNTSLQHGSFSQYDLAIERANLAEHRQELEQQLADRQDPGALAARAAALGMVASENPVFLRLADGGVSGTPVEATAPPPPPTTPATTPATPGAVTTGPATTGPAATGAAATVPPATPPVAPGPAPTGTGTPR